MDETTVYKDGKTESVKNQYLKGFQNAGWTTKPQTVPSDMLQGASTPNISTTPIKEPQDTGYYESKVATGDQAQQRQDKLDEVDKKINQGEQDIVGLLGDIGQAGNKQEQFIQQEGGDVAKKEYDRFTAELKAEQLSNRRKLEALDKNPQGLFGGALQDEKNRINRDSLSKQADLSILQETARGNYQTAYDIAERKTQAYLEPLKTKLQIEEFFFDNNKELFDKLEERQYSEKLAEKKREIEKTEKEMTDSTDLIKNAIAQGASTGLINNALKVFNEGGNSLDIARALGVYAGDVLDTKYKQAQIAKIYQDIANDKFVNSNPQVKTTEAQKASAGYANRIEFSNKILDNLSDTTGSMSFAQYKLVESNSSLANKLLSPEQQQVAQAMRNFVNAKLRKESGAAISPSEFSEARKQYFPQYGDSPEVLAQKKINRELALNGEIQSAAGAYSPLSEDVLSGTGMVSNPFKATLTGDSTIYNPATNQWVIPLK